MLALCTQRIQTKFAQAFSSLGKFWGRDHAVLRAQNIVLMIIGGFV